MDRDRYENLDTPQLKALKEVCTRASLLSMDRLHLQYQDSRHTDGFTSQPLVACDCSFSLCRFTINGLDWAWFEESAFEARVRYCICLPVAPTQHKAMHISIGRITACRHLSLFKIGRQYAAAIH